jgi:hypothetical protein
MRLLAIWFGANDACVPPSAQHIPLDDFKANLEKIIDLVKSPTSKFYSPSTEIVLLTPPPINTRAREADLKSREPPREVDRKFHVTESYAEAVREVAKAKSAFLVDIFTAVWVAAGETEEGLAPLLSDGLHFTEQGYNVCSELFLRTLSQIFRLCMKRYSRSSKHLYLTCTTRTCSPCFHRKQPHNQDLRRPADYIYRWDSIDWQNPGPSLRARNPIVTETT